MTGKCVVCGAAFVRGDEIAVLPPVGDEPEEPALHGPDCPLSHGRLLIAHWTCVTQMRFPGGKA